MEYQNLQETPALCELRDYTQQECDERVPAEKQILKKEGRIV